ncbi:MAG: type II toxin-antitoxin system VapC family toxin [Deltaproteobacteria bacterium]|nr:type II toxin-antitoxin system VapC family toxin [Deltaproteobacteria bacterium]
MGLAQYLKGISSLFLDTAPIIYYIEAHPNYGPLVSEVVRDFQSGRLAAYSSVMTLVEVLPKPIAMGNESLADIFSNFLMAGNNITILEITSQIAQRAGKLRGQYGFLKSMDAIQIATSMEVNADAFLTNDIQLKKVAEISALVLKDFLSEGDKA